MTRNSDTDFRLNPCDEDKGIFCTFPDRKMYHELTQALAILSKVGNRDLLAPILMDKNNGLVKITLSTSIYKYDALLMGDNKYIEFVADDIAQHFYIICNIIRL